MDVVGELMGILNKQVKITESLSKSVNAETALIDKNIVKSPNSRFGDITPAKLNSNEKKRTQEISSIFISKFFEEQKKTQKDPKLQTKITQPKILNGVGMGNMMDKSKKSNGWLGMLAGLVPFAYAMWELLKNKLSWVKNSLEKLLKYVKNNIQKILSKVFGAIKGFFTRIVGHIKGLWGKLNNSKIYKGIKGIIGKIISRIKGMFKSIGSKIGKMFKSIGRGILRLWERVKSSKAFTALEDAFESSKTLIRDFFQSVKEKILTIVKTVTKGIKSILPGGEGTAGKIVSSGKGMVGKALSYTGNMLARGGKAVGRGALAVGKGIVSGGKAVGRGALAVGEEAAELSASAAKKVISSAAKGVIASSGGMFRLMGRLTAKGAAKIPIIGPAIEGAFSYYDIMALKKELAEGKISEKELQRQAGRRVITGVGGLLGSSGGALLAGALGSIIPGAGTALGAIVGAIGGDLAGRFLSGIISDYILPPQYTKTIGAYVTGTTPPTDEMQDFIIKGDRVYPFSNKDELMGVKTGGAIDNFMKSNGADESMSILVNINMVAVQYLKAISNNSAIIAKAIGGGIGNATSPIINVLSPSPSPSEKTMINIPSNRSAYAGSPYALG